MTQKEFKELIDRVRTRVDEVGHVRGWGVCLALSPRIKMVNTFKHCFMPNSTELKHFKIDSTYWLYSHNRTPQQNKQDRLIALDFFEQIILDTKEYLEWL